MNNDLISRKALIEKLADVYRKNYAGTGKGEEFSIAIQKVCEQPNAYDVDKVIEQLEKCKAIMLSPTTMDCFGKECEHNDCLVCVFEKAIEVVKGGIKHED